MWYRRMRGTAASGAAAHRSWKSAPSKSKTLLAPREAVLASCRGRTRSGRTGCRTRSPSRSARCAPESSRPSATRASKIRSPACGLRQVEVAERDDVGDVRARVAMRPVGPPRDGERLERAAVEVGRSRRSRRRGARSGARSGRRPTRSSRDTGRGRSRRTAWSHRRRRSSAAGSAGSRAARPRSAA